MLILILVFAGYILVGLFAVGACVVAVVTHTWTFALLAVALLGGLALTLVGIRRAGWLFLILGIVLLVFWVAFGGIPTGWAGIQYLWQSATTPRVAVAPAAAPVVPPVAAAPVVPPVAAAPVVPPVAAAPVQPAASGNSQTSTVPAAGSTVMLKYDETGGSALIAGQSQLIALIIRSYEGPDGKKTVTQDDMLKMIPQIQAEAGNAKATTFVGKQFTPDRKNAWLVWVSNKNSLTAIPTDISDVLGSLRAGDGIIYIVVPFADGVPLPVHNTFSSTEDMWAVAVK